MHLETLTIVGVGLIGGSIGLAARRRGVAKRILGVGWRESSLEQAHRLGAIDQGFTELAPAVAEADLIVFCTPVQMIATQVLEAARVCRPGTLLTDAGSTKAALVQAIDAELPSSVGFVGSHPLAGSEKRGPEHADPNLYQGRLTIVTPTSMSDPAVVESICAFWRALESRVKLMSPNDHDAALALTSHVPHFLASVLAGASPDSLRELTATGFRDTTRIAAGDPTLWTGIFLQNREAVLAGLDQVAEQQEKFRSALIAGDEKTLHELLAQAKRVRDALEVEVAHQPGTTARVYLIDGDLTEAQVRRIAVELLTDATVETHALQPEVGELTVTVLPKPGVMDPVAESVQNAIHDLGLTQPQVRTGRRFIYSDNVAPAERRQRALRNLANDAVEEVHVGPLPDSAWGPAATTYTFRRIQVPLREMSDEALQRLSREGQLSLNLAEMRTIQEHYRTLGRDATDIELETIAQTWSEHCSHKTLKGRIEFTGPNGTIHYQNLLKETIFHATQEIRRRLGKDDWCVSVFADNAGIVRFDDQHHVCFKVETHNHPSAIEPYGGANTGLGGVIRDVLGTGLGGKPICNTDVFCFAPHDYPEAMLPKGVLHPRRVRHGVVAGVRDYGNRMGIPTVNGAICYDERYLANPLVYCGTVGLIPVGMEHKQVRHGDLIVAVGGRTGRDGIHGATFSSAELTHESESLSGGAVQIGNAITEKKVLDVILQARDRRLYHAITDCGAGGFSSAVGEMGAELGAEVHLDRAPLKYAGLSYCEIWISEAQERMVLAVPQDKWPELKELCAGEDVEATVLGEFKPTGRLTLFYQGQQVGDLDMHFLHEGRPPVVRKAVSCQSSVVSGPSSVGSTSDYRQLTKDILGSLNVCSKEWVIRQYDHEVQGGSVVKPLVGVRDDGPSDAAVIAPVQQAARGLAVGCGINPRYGDLDPYWMAASVIDEAVRNVVAVGSDPSRIALLDNFCWGNTDRPETLGSLVRAAEACRDVALAFGTPFISGKDSLNNEFHAGDVHITIPPTLLISALGIVPDVRRCVTMDLKKAGNRLLLLGQTKAELGGSHYHLVTGQTGGQVPTVDLELAPRLFKALHVAIRDGLITSCHDLSEGGLAVALAEMCFAGGLGARVALPSSALSVVETLFAESNTRFLLEVAAGDAERVSSHFQAASCPCASLGAVEQDTALVVTSGGNTVLQASIAELKEAWQKPLRS